MLSHNIVQLQALNCDLLVIYCDIKANNRGGLHTMIRSLSTRLMSQEDSCFSDRDFDGRGESCSSEMCLEV